MHVLQYTTVTSGTVTAQDTGQDVQLIHDAGVTATLTIAFPVTTFNGQKFGVMSAGGITTLTLSVSAGSITNAISTLAAGGCSTYQYVTAQSKWYKIY
jgi:hypothetical protein